MNIKIQIDREGVQKVEIYADCALEQAEAHAILQDISFEIQAIDGALKMRAAKVAMATAGEKA